MFRHYVQEGQSIKVYINLQQILDKRSLLQTRNVSMCVRQIRKELLTDAFYNSHSGRDYKDRLNTLNMHTQEDGRIRGDLI